MLKLFMEYKGAFPKKMLRKAVFRPKHFDDAGSFLSQEKDPISKKPVLRVLSDIRATKDLIHYLVPARKEVMTEKEMKKVLSLKDLLEKCFVLDPAKRITPQDALLHPFLAPS